MVKSLIKTINMETLETSTYKMLRKYGINHDEAMMLANSHKGYWRISSSAIIHRAIKSEKFIK